MQTLGKSMSQKDSVNGLAIFGGRSAFLDKLHVGRPNIGTRDRLIERINDMLDRQWFTNNGPFVIELEERIKEFLGCKHCILMCNGTVALEIAIRALDLQGEVIVPSFTFIATPHALQWQQITPVFCDIAPGSHNIDPSRIESLITPRTTGIMGVHVWGRACNIDALTEIAQRHQLKLMFDAAHAFACSHQQRMIGNFGDVEVFSFHATKFFNTFEGGAVTTNNDDLAEKIRYMRNFGFAGYDDVKFIGTNGKMTEVSAAMGLTSLECLQEIIDSNHKNYTHYHQRLGNLKGIKLHSYDENERNNYQYIVLEIDELETGINRDRIVKILHKENVLARRYFYPGCHQMEPYRSYFPHAGLLLPETERVTHRVISLPTGRSVNIEDIDIICNLIEFIVYNSETINHRWSEIID